MVSLHLFLFILPHVIFPVDSLGGDVSLHVITHYGFSTRSLEVPKSSLLIQRSPASKNASLQLSRRFTLFLKVLKKQRKR